MNPPKEPTTPAPTQAEVEAATVTTLETEPATVATAPSTERAFAKPKHMKRNVLIAASAAVLVVGGGVAAYFMMTPATKPAPATPVAVATPAPAPTLSNDEKLAAALSHIKNNLPNTAAIDNSNKPSLPHRLLPAPYDFYASGTEKAEWQLATKPLDTAKAAETMKAVDAYLTGEQQAKAEVLIGENIASFLIANPDKDGGVLYSRYSNDAYTCGVTESIDYDEKGTAISGAHVSLSCSTVDAYKKNADIQKPYYMALYAADAEAKKSQYMLSLPDALKKSKTEGYATTQVVSSDDASLVGGAVALFYQTPDGIIHYFKSTQNSLMCSEYTTPDLKKAYLGDICYKDDGSSAGEVSL